MRVTVYKEDLDVFAARLEASGSKIIPIVRGPFVKAAMQIKRATQANFRESGNGGFRRISEKVQYDEPRISGAELYTDIGVDKGGPGTLGNIAVFGTWKGGGTRKHPVYHALEEVPVMNQHLLDAVDKVL